MNTTPTRADLRDKIATVVFDHEVNHPDHLLAEIMKTAESHDANLKRAPWWREVTDPEEVVPAGCPARFEYVNNKASENVSSSPRRVRERLLARGEPVRVFIDTRWTPPTPPPAPLAVGDVIETVEDLERLPECAGLVDDDGDLWQVDRDEAVRRWLAANG